jgi:hypothetical protein
VGYSFAFGECRPSFRDLLESFKFIRQLLVGLHVQQHSCAVAMLSDDQGPAGRLDLLDQRGSIRTEFGDGPYVFGQIEGGTRHWDSLMYFMMYKMVTHCQVTLEVQFLGIHDDVPRTPYLPAFCQAELTPWRSAEAGEAGRQLQRRVERTA